MTPDQIPSAASSPCSRCQQSKSVDSLTGRCTACDPIQLSDLEPSIQDYARRARWQKYKEFLVGFSLGPVSMGIILFYSSRGKGVAPWFFWLIVIATPILMGASIYSLFQKRQSLLRYYRLGQVSRFVTPIDAQLQYEAAGGRYPHSYFLLCELAPGSNWPDSLGRKFEIDIPPRSEERAVKNDFWTRFFEGFDPGEKPKLWAKVFIDPDQSGSALIRVADHIFVTKS
jgi:hypothetical protein